MKTMVKWIAVAFMGITLSATTSCKKKTSTPPAEQAGTVKVRFDYVFGANQLPWQIGKTMVHPKTGDTMTITLLRFYVSNIKFKKADGSWWVHPDSYFLVDAKSVDESTLTISDVPAGSYTAMEYTMGVDSIKNVSGAHEGALSFTHGMFWDWNSGYIMMKIEGNSPNAPGGIFAIHMGGFSGPYNVVSTYTANFSSSGNMSVNSSKTPVIKMLANPARVWHSSPGLDSIYIIHSPGPDAHRIAKDFFNAVTFNGIE